jgi:hypothetical protein
VVRELNQQKANYENSCSRGFSKDFAEYKHLCGTIQGLGFAIEFITDLVQKMEHSDD